MTVNELIKKLKKMPIDAKVYTMNEPGAVDENGCLTDLHKIIEYDFHVY